MLLASLGAGHLPFTSPSSGPAGPDRTAATGEWQMIHVLAEGCDCSNRVRAYLRRRPGIRGVRERMVPADGARRLRWANREVELGAAPLLIVIAPDGRVRYAGGYSRRPDAKDGFHDQEILGRLAADVPVEPFPVFGCATPRDLRSLVDAPAAKALLH
ncbi:MAG: hypothetical protein NTZ56_05260 [Acidobacteria bacterium]|nr:hypothetical protein [Acidobacteriota bacterium]